MTAHDCKYEYRWEDMAKKIDEIHKAIYGNGKEGLVIEMDRNSRHRRFMEQWGWLIVTGITSIPFTVFCGFIMLWVHK